MEEVQSRKRLSREESRAQTRGRLLEAAFAVFIKHGIEAASIEDIAEEAGYSRGAFYSNFESKEELFCALLENKAVEVSLEVGRILSSDGSPAEVIERVRQFYVMKAADREQCVFWLAVKLYALRTPSVLPRVAELEAADHQRMIGYVKATFGAIKQEPPVDPETVAYGLKALAVGMGLENALNIEGKMPEKLNLTLRALFDRISGAANLGLTDCVD